MRAARPPRCTSYNGSKQNKSPDCSTHIARSLRDSLPSPEIGDFWRLENQIFPMSPQELRSCEMRTNRSAICQRAVRSSVPTASVGTLVSHGKGGILSLNQDREPARLEVKERALFFRKRICNVERHLVIRNVLRNAIGTRSYVSIQWIDVGVGAVVFGSHDATPNRKRRTETERFQQRSTFKSAPLGSRFVGFSRVLVRISGYGRSSVGMYSVDWCPNQSTRRDFASS